jgi:hypothetical protein
MISGSVDNISSTQKSEKISNQIPSKPQDNSNDTRASNDGNSLFRGKLKEMKKGLLKAKKLQKKSKL